MKVFVSVLCVLLCSQNCMSKDITNQIAHSKRCENPQKLNQITSKGLTDWVQGAWNTGWLFGSGSQPQGKVTPEEMDAMEEDLTKYLQRQAKSSASNSWSEWGWKTASDTFFSLVTIPDKVVNGLYGLGQTDIANLGKFTTDPLIKSFVSVTTKHVGLKSWKLSAYVVKYNDPFWRRQWYVQDYRTHSEPVMDLNVVPVHEMGYKGKNVLVAIVDCGVIHDHPDLKGNFDVSLSYNYCFDKSGSDPLEPTGKKSSHGTECAGVVGMVADNGICGVGIAPKATIIGVKLLCSFAPYGDVYAKALTHKYTLVDIYSNSWGPPDDPLTVTYLNHLVANAFKLGVTKGRDGKGAIYVQSAGNGAIKGDNCAADCYINAPEVIAIGAANQFGKKSDFSERCAAVFAVTYSGSWFPGYIGTIEGVVAPTADKGCGSEFSGTSAAAPLASGIIALTLEANPDLTYRDVMHLIAMSSEVAPLADNPDTWNINGRGLWVSSDFGFGLMNAKNMVKMANKKTWKTVPEKHSCIVSIDLDQTKPLGPNDPVIIEFTTHACSTSRSEAIRYLEHMQVSFHIDFAKRGAIGIRIRSPAGTRSDFLEYRPKDTSSEGIYGLNIASVHYWGEDPRGDWEIEVKIDPTCLIYTPGKVYGVDITFLGTYEMPDHYKKPRVYASFMTPEGKSSPKTSRTIAIT